MGTIEPSGSAMEVATALRFTSRVAPAAVGAAFASRRVNGELFTATAVVPVVELTVRDPLSAVSGTCGAVNTRSTVQEVGLPAPPNTMVAGQVPVDAME